MAKQIKKEMPLVNPNGKSVKDLKEVANALQQQVVEHNSLVQHHTIMLNKAQGALEVMLQMIPKEDVEGMIKKEAEESRNDN